MVWDLESWALLHMNCCCISSLSPSFSLTLALPCSLSLCLPCSLTLYCALSLSLPFLLLSLPLMLSRDVSLSVCLTLLVPLSLSLSPPRSQSFINLLPPPLPTFCPSSLIQPQCAVVFQGRTLDSVLHQTGTAEALQKPADAVCFVPACALVLCMCTGESTIAERI